MRLAPLCIALAACVGGRPLADMRATIISIEADDASPDEPPTFAAYFDPPDCADFAPDVSASFAGVPLDIVAPFRDEDGSCVQGSLIAPTLPAGFYTGAAMTLELHDSTDAWHITFPGLWNGDLQATSAAVIGQPLTFAWIDGPPIENACFSITGWTDWPDANGCRADGNPTISADNTVAVDIDLASSTQEVIDLDLVGEFDVGDTTERERAPDAICDGPAGCSIELSVQTDLTLSVSF